MASKHRPLKNEKSSIRYWWIPVELQSFESDSAFTNEEVHRPPSSAAKGSKQHETKYLSNRVSTSQFLSAVVGIWDCVGQPASHSKLCLRNNEIFFKENTICYSDSQNFKSTSSVGGENFSKDLTSRSYSPSSVKSKFEDLRTFKRVLCFASCNRAINDLSTLSDFCSDADSGFDKETDMEITTDLPYEYGKMIATPFSCLEDQATPTANGIHGTDRIDIFGKNGLSANYSSISSIESNSTTEDEISNHVKDEKLVENEPCPHDSPYTTISLISEPVTSTEETIITSTNPLGILTSADLQLGKHQESMGSSCVTVETLSEVSTSKDQYIHEESKSSNHEIIDEGNHPTRHLLSVEHKILLAFAKNKHALAGGMAGTLVSLCLHPVDTVKTVIQSNAAAKKSSWRILRKIVSERGVLGLYRGIASNIAASAPISAIYTYTYESVKGALLPVLPKEYHSFVHCFAGACSSIATSIVFTPSERIKQQMQVGSHYNNCWSALIGCLEKGGVPSLYAGWGACLCRNIPHSIIKFYTYENLKQLLLTTSEPTARLTTLQTLVCGGVAGSTAALFTTPFDVVKTRLQTQVPGSLAKYSGVLHALQEIAREEGLRGLYRGLTPRLAMYVSQGAIFFASYEFLKVVFSFDIPREPSRVIENEEHADCKPPILQKLKS